MHLRHFFKGNPRTVKAKKNIAASFCLKGIDAVVYLLLVPVTLGYLNPYEYGIWLTLNSILAWINSFDIGLGNGMRNKLAAAIAKGDRELGRIYVSTTFLMLIGLMGVLILIGTIVGPFIDWFSILNTTPEHVPHLDQIVYLAFVIFCINFIFKFVGNVYLAMQLPAINNIMVVSGHILSLIIIYFLTLTTSGSLFWVALTYTTAPLLVYLIAYPITFLKVFPFLLPNIRMFRRKYLKDLFNLGIQFFLLQLSGILLFTCANLLISHMFGPENVTPYSISYRLFSLVPMAMNIILAPIWSATTDAYVRGEIEWIKRTLQGIKKILIGAYVVIFIMVLLSRYIYHIWIGSEVHISLELTSVIGLYVAILISSLAFSNILNGLGKIKLQTYNTILMAVIFIPICFLLGRKFGIVGIVYGMCIVNLSGLVINYIQLHKVLDNSAKGLWNK